MIAIYSFYFLLSDKIRSEKISNNESIMPKILNQNKYSKNNVFLNILHQHFQANFQHAKQGNRKIFSIYIKILSGNLLYDTFKANAQFAIPSNAAVKRYINQKTANIFEGVLRIEELLK